MTVVLIETEYSAELLVEYYDSKQCNVIINVQ